MAEPTDKDRHNAAMITGSMSEGALEQSLRQEIAQSLADEREQAEARGRAEASGGRIRVLRMIEYVYPDTGVMVADMEHWNLQGVLRTPDGKTMRSTTLPPEVLR